MRNRHGAAFLSLIFAVVLGESAAQADRIHLPCDPDIAVSLGTGIFTGRTDTQDIGNIHFERIQPGYLRLEASVFQNCDDIDGDHGKVTRHWLGRLNFYGSIAPEDTTLSFTHDPKTVPVLDDAGMQKYDSMGNPLTKTENTLVKADLDAGLDFSGGFGARLSLFDGEHFHVETFAEYATSFGWNPAHANTVVAHALENDLDVTRLVQDHTSLRYRWHMINTGVTIGVPLRPNTFAKNRLTPFVSIGYTWFKADIDLSLDENVTRSLEALNVNVDSITKRRTIAKDSVTFLGGARLDFNNDFSLESSMMFGKTSYTTVYWVSLSAIVRFDYDDVAHALGKIF